MVLRSWLVNWHRHTHQVLGRVHKSHHRERQRSEFGSNTESLEQRCLLATIDLATLGTAGISMFGANAGDHAGGALSNAGDVNGDGYDDIFIGASGSAGAGGEKTNSGVSYIVFGGPTLPSNLDLLNLGTAGVTIYGATSEDLSGSAVASAGDLNGDGFGDLIIGAPLGDGPDESRIDAGETYVIFGSAALPATIDLGNLGAAGVTIWGAEALDGAGTAVSRAGDVNGDGFADFMIGAGEADGLDNLKDAAGETYLIFGGPTLQGTIDLGNLGTSGMTIYGADSADNSGVAISPAGDVNEDGFRDLLIGAPNAAGADNTQFGTGESYIVFGRALLPASLDLATLGADGITIFGIDANDQSGFSVAGSGDVNHDGFSDVIIGASKGDGANNSKNRAGETYVVFGGDLLPSVINLADLGSDGVTIFGVAAADLSGASVTMAGDFNADGFEDVLIGTGREVQSGDSRLSAGWSYVVFGGNALPETIDLATLDSAGIAINGVDLGDRSGLSVSRAGDVNADGFDDLLIGAPASDGDGNSQIGAGEAYLVYGSGNHTPVFTTPSSISVAENETAVITAIATDSDLPAQSVTYSISGGADQNKFSITSDGVLTFVAAPDFESPNDVSFDNIYVLQITASDGQGGVTNQSLTVTVTPVNEPPEFITSTTLSVTEFTTYVATVKAEDADLPAQPVTYSITGGADQARFAITSDGVLTFVTPPDFLMPADAGHDNVYDLLITASDSTGQATTEAFEVAVTSANFHVPVFTSSAAFNIFENSTAVGTVKATDQDLPAQTVSYLITGGADQFKFVITTGGVLSFVTPPNFEIPTDVGANNVYNIQVRANDGNGGMTVQQIAITVKDVDDAPRLALGGNTVSWVNRQAPVTILPLVNVTGGASVANGTLTITVNASGSARKITDQFFFPSMSALGSTTGAQYARGKLTLQIQLNGTVTSTQVQTFLRGITFSTKTTGLRQTTRSFSVTLANIGVPPSTITQVLNVRRR